MNNPSNIYNETVAKIVGNSNSKLLTILAKKSNLDAWLGPDCFCRWIKQNSTDSNGDISQTTSKDGVILFNYLHLMFRSINCLSVIRLLTLIWAGFSGVCFEVGVEGKITRPTPPAV